MNNAIKERITSRDARNSHALHRTTIAAPRALVDEALELGEMEGLTSLNAVVQMALREFTTSRRRAAFAAAMEEMGHDPEVVRASDEISALFSTADADGLA